MITVLDTITHPIAYPEAISRMLMMHRHVRQHEQPKSPIGTLWFLQHQPVITRGALTSNNEVHGPATVPVYTSERGGKATFHGPGQLVIYPVVSLSSFGLNIRQWVDRLLSISTATIQSFGVPAYKDCKTIGVYTGRGKIASLGIRVRKGVTMHGVSINVNLQPNGFDWIDPCGVHNGPVDQVSAYTPCTINAMKTRWLEQWRLHDDFSKRTHS